MTIPRSYLFVPGDRPDRFDKAVATGADIVVLDLEDAVLPKAKTGAREAIRNWLRNGGRAAVRVNGIATEWHEEDRVLLATPGVAAAILPKAEEPATLAAFASALPQGLPIVPLIESALGIWNARELAGVNGVTRLAFGSIDFQLDTGIEAEGEALLYARSRLVLASAIARIAPPVDGVTIAMDDEERLRADIAAARALGFGGKLCIHPRQVLAVHAGFQPDEATLAWARAVMAAARTSDAGAVRVDGKLIDRPVVERAKKILEDTRPYDEACIARSTRASPTASACCRGLARHPHHRVRVPPDGPLQGRHECQNPRPYRRAGQSRALRSPASGSPTCPAPSFCSRASAREEMSHG